MIIPAGFAQVNFKFTGSSLPTGAQITFGVRHDASPLSPVLVATTLATNWIETAMGAHISANVNLSSVLVKFGPNETGAAAEVAVSDQGTGGAQAGPQIAYLGVKYTNFGGRRSRGRFFIPGVPESAINPDGLILPAQVTSCTLALQEFLAKCDADDLPLHLLHADATAPYQLADLQCHPRSATQRRRNRR